MQIRLGPGSTEDGKGQYRASGLLASAIPFVFVGAVIVLGACIFEAVGQHASPARSGASFQAEAASPEQVLTVADAPHDVAQRQAGKHAHGDARHHDAQSRSHSRVRPSPFEFGCTPLRKFAVKFSRYAWACGLCPLCPRNRTHDENNRVCVGRTLGCQRHRDNYVDFAQSD